MAHRLRQDHAGSWQHGFARGRARRTVFGHRRGVRVCTRLLALECRRGTLDVPAPCFSRDHANGFDLLHLVDDVDKNPIAARLATVRDTYALRAPPKLPAQGEA